MEPRVTPADVRAIIDTEFEDASITACIQGAHLVVEKMLSDKSLGEELLSEIERWLAAHYVASTTEERQAVHEEAGPANQRFANIFGPLLMSSTYGQTAAQLDVSGTLAGLGRRGVQLISISE